MLKIHLGRKSWDRKVQNSNTIPAPKVPGPEKIGGRIDYIGT